MTLFSQIMDAVKDARAACARDAEGQRRDFKFQRWRQTEVTGGDGNGNRHGPGEPIFFGGQFPLTKRNLLDALRQLRDGGAVTANIAGGIDGGDYFDSIDSGDYQPYIAEWDVSIDAGTMVALLAEAR